MTLHAVLVTERAHGLCTERELSTKPVKNSRLPNQPEAPDNANQPSQKVLKPMPSKDAPVFPHRARMMALEDGTPARCDICSTRSRCLLSQAGQDVRERIAPHIVERSVRIGSSIEAQGEGGDHLGVIKLGLFKGERVNDQHERTPVCLLGRGRIFGFGNLFKQPATLTLTAVMPARLCQIPIAILYDRAFVDRGFRQYIYQSIGRYIDTLADWSRLPREGGISGQLLQALRLIAAEEGSRSFRIPSHIELGLLLGARRESVARHIGLLIQTRQLVKLDRWHGILDPTPEELALLSAPCGPHRSHARHPALRRPLD
jgi:CRP-like cAMP-binding protein